MTDGSKLIFDLNNLRHLDRRRMLGLFAAGGGAAVVGACGDGPFGKPPMNVENGPVVTATGADGMQCVGYAQETNGPYPADGTNSSSGATSNALTAQGIVRNDIRSDFLSGSAVAAGIPLTLDIRLVDVNDACRPLTGYAVYAWHCDAEGKYSLYDLPQRSYLRGVQVSDAEGRLGFSTIFPGCYEGRYPHIHFEVFSSLDKASSGRHAVLISQFAMAQSACEDAYMDPRYGDSADRLSRLSIAKDNVFGDNGEECMKAMTLDMTGSRTEGYVGKAVIGIAT